MLGLSERFRFSHGREQLLNELTWATVWLGYADLETALDVLDRVGVHAADYGTKRVVINVGMFGVRSGG